VAEEAQERKTPERGVRDACHHGEHGGQDGDVKQARRYADDAGRHDEREGCRVQVPDGTGKE
jgi:hypothetical protein